MNLQLLPNVHLLVRDMKSRQASEDTSLLLFVPLDAMRELPWPLDLPLESRYTSRYEQVSVGWSSNPQTVQLTVDRAWTANKGSSLIIVASEGGYKGECC